MKLSTQHRGYRYFHLALAIGLINLVMVSNSVYADDYKGNTTNHAPGTSAPTPGEPPATAPAAEKTPLDKAKEALNSNNVAEAIKELSGSDKLKEPMSKLFTDPKNEGELKHKLTEMGLDGKQAEQFIEQLRKDKIKELTDAAEKNKSLTADQQKELYNAMKLAMDQLLNEEGKKALTKDPQKLAQLAKIYQEIQNKNGSLTKEDYERVAHAWGRFAGPEGRKWEEIGKLKPKEGDRFGKALKELAQVKQNQILKGPAFEGNQAAEASRKDYFEKLAAIKSEDQNVKAAALAYFKEKYGNDADAMNFFLRESTTDPQTRNSYAEIAMHLAPKNEKGASVFSFGDNKVLNTKSTQELQLALFDAKTSEAAKKHGFGDRFVASAKAAELTANNKQNINLNKVLKDERAKTLRSAQDEHAAAKLAMDKARNQRDGQVDANTGRKLADAENKLRIEENRDVLWKSVVADRKVARAEERVQKAQADVGDAESAVEQAKDAVARAKEVRSDLKEVKRTPKEQKPAATQAVAKKQIDAVSASFGEHPFDSQQTRDAIAKTTDALHEFASTHSSPKATPKQKKEAREQAKTAVKEQVAAFKEVQTTSEAALKAKQDEHAKEAERLARQQKRKAELAKRLTRAAQPK